MSLLPVEGSAPAAQGRDLPAPVEIRSTDYRTAAEFDAAVHRAAKDLQQRAFRDGDTGWLDYEHDPKRAVTRISARRA